MSNSNRQHKSLVFICVMGMLTALEIVLERLLGFNVLTMKVNLAFIPMALAAYLYGPVGGAIVYGLGDIIGTLLIPTAGGGYNPLFTLTNIFVGITYGLLLSQNIKVWKIILCPLLSRTLGTLGLNTLWIYLLFIKGKKSYLVFMLSRVPEAAIMLAVELLILIPLFISEKYWLKPTKNQIK